MLSAKENSCFPYASKLVCYIEVFPDGRVEQLSGQTEKRKGYADAIQGLSKIVAVWPGQWRSDLFLIDDLSLFKQGLKL